MKRNYCLLLVTLLLLTANGFAQKPDPVKMKLFVDALMKKMIIDEKIGQLNLPGSGDIVTGQAQSSDIGKKIKAGQVGGLFNIKGVEKIREAPRWRSSP